MGWVLDWMGGIGKEDYGLEDMESCGRVMMYFSTGGSFLDGYDILVFPFFTFG